MRVRGVLSQIPFLMIPLALIAFSACVTTQPGMSATIEIPLPPIIIEPANSSLPKNLAKLLGKWEGTWDIGLDHILVVEAIAPDGENASVIYAHGANIRRRINIPRWYRKTAKIKDGLLTFEFPSNGATVSYYMNDDGTLTGIYEWLGGYSTKAILKKVE